MRYWEERWGREEEVGREQESEGVGESKEKRRGEKYENRVVWKGEVR